MKLKKSGSFRMSRGSSLPCRLSLLYDFLIQLWNSYDPQEVALEKVFVHRNPLSALTLAYSRGLVLTIAGQKNTLVTEYAPTSIKQAITGHGHACKEQVAAMVERLFSITPSSWDEADAIALGFCHLYSLTSSPL